MPELNASLESSESDVPNNFGESDSAEVKDFLLSLISRDYQYKTNDKQITRLTNNMATRVSKNKTVVLININFPYSLNHYNYGYLYNNINNDYIKL